MAIGTTYYLYLPTEECRLKPNCWVRFLKFCLSKIWSKEHGFYNFISPNISFLFQDLIFVHAKQSKFYVTVMAMYLSGLSPSYSVLQVGGTHIIVGVHLIFSSPGISSFPFPKPQIASSFFLLPSLLYTVQPAYHFPLCDSTHILSHFHISLSF